MDQQLSFSSLSVVVVIAQLIFNMKPVIVFFVIIGLTLGLPEKPAPYPAKGWKPQGARLELPRQYGAPKAAPESVEFTTLTNEYLAPATTVQNDEDILRVQGLPRADAVSQFNNVNVQQTTVKARQPQVARIQMAPAPAFIGQPFLLSPLFAPQFAPTNGQLQERQFNQQQQQQRQFSQQQEFDSPKNDAQQLPSRAYGPPQSNNNVPEETTEQPEVPRREEPNQPESVDEYDEDQADSDEPTVAVSNSETTGNLVQETQQGQVGQYYILLPDNSLQKVRFATKQTTEDRQINGFSAQLR